MADVDRWIGLSKSCKYLPEKEFINLCGIVGTLLTEEPNVVEVSTPVSVCGDIHGQFYDLEELFRIGGQVPDTSYVFMGDYVDRGFYSLETLTRLLTLKARWPERITLIRGNHESRRTTKVYGFYDECSVKYGNSNVWDVCCRLFDLLPVAALLDAKILCVHGGIAQDAATLDSIRSIDRNQEIPFGGPLCDLLWSDPDDVDDWLVSPRGAGCLFGPAITHRFMEINDLSLICRAHQLVQEGYKYMFQDSIVTVWSAPNYCYRCGNMASFLEFKTVGKGVPKLFSAVPISERVFPPRKITPYFL